MIIYKNIDGSIEIERSAGVVARHVMRSDVELVQARGLPANLVDPNPLYSSAYVRQYDFVGEFRGDPGRGTSPVRLYAEARNVDLMAADQIRFRLPGCQAEWLKMGAFVAKMLEFELTNRPDAAGALLVAHDAWLAGRDAEAQGMLRAVVPETVAVAVAQQWLAEEWATTAVAGTVVDDHDVQGVPT